MRYTRAEPFCAERGCLRVRNVVLLLYPIIKERYRRLFTSALRKLGSPGRSAER
jgi:hypothetical protein